MGSRAEHFRREFRGERRGCQSPAAAGDWLRRRVGSALSRYRCGGREAAQKWLSYLPLYRPRRLRRPDSSLHRMHVVVRQRPRCYRTSRGGTRDLRACAFMPKPSRITLRGCRSEDRRAVGQFSSNLLNGRFDHLRHAAQQDLGGSILARLIPTARYELPISDSRFVAAGLSFRPCCLFGDVRMTRRKFEITGHMNEREFPHIVELELPPGGFRSKGLEFDAFHRERGIPIRRGRGRHEVEQFHIRFCFPDAATADAFQGRFGGTRLTYSPSRPSAVSALLLAAGHRWQGYDAGGSAALARVHARD